MSNKNNSSSEPVQLKREIGVFGGISIIGGIMIGSGIFYLGSYVLQRTNMSFGWALVCWIIGGIVSLLGGLCFAELGASDPKAGGMIVYLNKAFHPAVKETPVIALNVTSGAGNLLSSPFVPSSSLSHATVIQEIQATKNNIIFFIPKYLK